jgi:hypothetical protein
MKNREPALRFKDHEDRVPIHIQPDQVTVPSPQVVERTKWIEYKPQEP